AKKAYDKAVSDGQKVLDDNNASQADVDKAAKAIEDAKGNLNGEATNKDALKSAIDDQPTTQGSANYKNSTSDSQKAYNDAVADGKKVYDNPTASQTDVDNAKKAIDDAKKALDGKDTDKTALTNDVNGQSATHNDPSYINGSEEAKKAYDKAVSDG
ncbi:FIVAR domain-containing protein, partial [Limosilactobacillus sp. STM2_1]